MTTVTIDPITRIEGHLKSEVSVTNGLVTDAKVSGTMARGIEQLLLGRDPRDATYVTERICGVCFGSHGWASSLAVEQAQGTTLLPNAARLLRNLIVGAAWLHDHVLHFYHLAALDYLDLRVVADYQGSDPYILKVKELALAELGKPPVEGEYAGPLMPNYSYDDPYFVRDLASVSTLLRHYLDALLMQVKAKRMSALLAGKQPHQSGIVVGGVTQLPTVQTVDAVRGMLAEQAAFIEQTYVADVVGLAKGPLWPLAASSVGVGYQNYLSYGGFPQADGTFLYPEGALVGGTLVTQDRKVMAAAISEDVARAWYAAASAGVPATSTQVFDLDKVGAYTFVKAPRYDGNPMEVGPLARMMVALRRPDHPAYDHRAVQQLRQLTSAGMQAGAVARHAARALETLMLCDAMSAWLTELRAVCAQTNVVIHDTAHWEPPLTGQGMGLIEAPRGALGHWITIDKALIKQYACVVPTTWNGAPTGADGRRGPIEQALMGCPVASAENPVNVVRVIRSFDPCLACAVHAVDLTQGRTGRCTVA